MDVMASEAVSKFFMDQCLGEHNGHMSMIPNNPVLSGLLKAHSVRNKGDFARFLRTVADNLEKDQSF